MVRVDFTRCLHGVTRLKLLAEIVERQPCGGQGLRIRLDEDLALIAAGNRHIGDVLQPLEQRAERVGRIILEHRAAGAECDPGGC